MALEPHLALEVGEDALDHKACELAPLPAAGIVGDSDQRPVAQPDAATVEPARQPLLDNADQPRRAPAGAGCTATGRAGAGTSPATPGRSGRETADPS